MKHSIAQEVAEREGISIRSVQRLVRKAAPERERTWLTPAHVNAEAVVVAIQKGRARCYNHPCRYALAGQMSLFD